MTRFTPGIEIKPQPNITAAVHSSYGMLKAITPSQILIFLLKVFIRIDYFHPL
jgi:hypothetical protein